MGTIQEELDQVKQIHNTHRIRTYTNQEYPSGHQISFIMFQKTLVNSCYKYSIKTTLHPNFTIFFSLFILSNTTNKIATVTEMELNNVLSSNYYANKSNFECVPEFEELALRLMLVHNLTFPTNVEEARQLYDNLLSSISITENS